ncbi:MAG: NAD(P)H-dependent oxidoreductase [Chloroflexi bacterium]|nr:NAD(P)H-dependent oxidoreductase [Chloroflexota bacterium]
MSEHISRRAVLLVGSAKHPSSTSESLGRALLERLEGGGYRYETIKLVRALRSEEGTQVMIQAVKQADLVVFAFPLYVDTLPTLATKALEQIAASRVEPTTPPQFVAIVNCGFPEVEHMALAIEVCERFAKTTGFEWMGALALGGGQAVNGQPLDELGGMMRHAIEALNLAAEALLQDQAIPQEAVDLMATPFIPPRLYTMMGGWGWRRQAAQMGTKKNLRDRPYKE